MTSLPHDEVWLEELFERFHGHVRAYARRRCPQAAEDIVIEVFAAAWLDRDKVPEEPLPWLYRAAHNRVISSQRAHRRQERLRTKLLRLYAPQAPPAEIGHEPWVDDLLESLSQEDAELLKLSAWEGLTPSEIAFVVGCSQGAARTRLHRARVRAQRILEEGTVRTHRRAAGRNATYQEV